MNQTSVFSSAMPTREHTLWKLTSRGVPYPPGTCHRPRNSWMPPSYTVRSTLRHLRNMCDSIHRCLKMMSSGAHADMAPCAARVHSSVGHQPPFRFTFSRKRMPAVISSSVHDSLSTRRLLCVAVFADAEMSASNMVALRQLFHLLASFLQHLADERRLLFLALDFRVGTVNRDRCYTVTFVIGI